MDVLGIYIWYIISVVFFLSRNATVLTCIQKTQGYKIVKDTGVSKNRDTPKWMVYNGKPY